MIQKKDRVKFLDKFVNLGSMDYVEYLWVEFKESMKLGGRNIISLFSIASNLNFIPSIMNVVVEHRSNGSICDFITNRNPRCCHITSQ